MNSSTSMIDLVFGKRCLCEVCRNFRFIEHIHIAPTEANIARHMLLVNNLNEYYSNLKKK